MSDHVWSFFRAGGVDQVKLETADDLRYLAQLDKKLWVALSMPVKGVFADGSTLALVDRDHDGRIGAEDILAAVGFVVERLVDPAVLFAAPQSVRLDALRADNSAGTVARAAAAELLAAIGKGDSTAVLLSDVKDPTVLFANLPFNGDGVVTSDAAANPAQAACMADIVSCFGASTDRNGKGGIDLPKIDAFFAACAARVAWLDELGSLPKLRVASVPDASAAVKNVRAKVEDYFDRARVVAFDGRAAAALDFSESSFVNGVGTQADTAIATVESLPLGHIQPSGELRLGVAINPAWRARMHAAVAAWFEPMLGEKPTLSADEWRRLELEIAPWDAWLSREAGTTVAALPESRIRELHASPLADELRGLVALDVAGKGDADGFDDVVQLVHYVAFLGQILRNFVNFSDFYGRKRRALFQAGRAYFDRRSYDLVLPVLDAGRHASMAPLSGAYLVYLSCIRRSDGRAVEVCVGVTDGDTDNLAVGRNGLFYDREDHEYDATITKIIDNPISIRQAFWSPYKKFARSVEAFVNKRAAAAEAESDAKLASAAANAAGTPAVAPAPVAVPVVIPKIDVGTVAALGVAIGGITAALGAILDAVFGLGYWMPLGIVALVLVISGPSMIIAALKLRRRNVGPLLDADGWAVNAAALVNLPFGRSLTQLAELPPGSHRDAVDPFATKSRRGPVIFAVILLCVLGFAMFAAAKGLLLLP